ncbi:MAG TPA: metal-dependent hydrolase [bacterium]|nr:metal-dependent hydrolase [bacterium]
MDTITHLLHGYSIYFFLRKDEFIQEERRALYRTALIFSILPDFDYIFKLFGDIAYFRHHRGITHSIFFNILLILFFYLFLKKKKNSIPKTITICASLNLAAHIIFDLLTSYGTMILEPFSNKRYALDLFFILDIFIWAALLFPLIINFITKKFVIIKTAVVLSFVAIIFYAFYVFNFQKSLANKTNYILDNSEIKLIKILPSFILYNYQKAILEDKHYYYYADLYDENRFITTQFEKFDKSKLQQISIFNKAVDSEILDFYLWFSRFPVYYIKENKNDLELAIFDLRFYSETFDIRDNSIFGLKLVYNKFNDELSYKFRGASGKL